MATFKLELKGVQATINSIRGSNLKENAELALKNFGQNVVADAQDLVPVDDGALKRSIGYTLKGLVLTIDVNSTYAAYVEFGTKRYAAKQVAALPPDWKTFAAKFKGSSGSGSFDEFVQNIMRWVQSKGIGALQTKSGNNSTSRASLDAMQSAAYAIALNIIQNGIKAHPYLYPAIYKNTGKLERDLQNL